MQKADVYLFGQILGTRSFLLKDGFLKPDEYSEIQESCFLPGGETGTAPMMLPCIKMLQSMWYPKNALHSIMRTWRRRKS